MAADVLRITYKELEEIARRNEQKAEEDSQAAIKEAQKKKREEEREKRRAKRPTRGIYQPPSIIRHRQGEDDVPQGETWETEDSGDQQCLSTDTWDEASGPSSKEDSVERELENVSEAIKNIQMAHNKEQKTSSSEHRRRKRPEMQRYVPKGKILEQQLGDEEVKETWIDGMPQPSPSVSPALRTGQHSPSPHSPSLVSSPSPRKIDLKNMQVTVINEAANETDSPSSQSTTQHQPSGSAKQGHQQSSRPSPLQQQQQESSRPSPHQQQQQQQSSRPSPQQQQQQSSRPSPHQQQQQSSRPSPQQQQQQSSRPSPHQQQQQSSRPSPQQQQQQQSSRPSPQQQQQQSSRPSPQQQQQQQQSRTSGQLPKTQSVTPSGPQMAAKLATGQTQQGTSGTAEPSQVHSASQPASQSHGQSIRGRQNVRGHRYGQRGNRHGVGGERPGQLLNQQGSEQSQRGETADVKSGGKPSTHQNQDLYVVPSRPNTIGQEAARTATIGKEDNSVAEIEPASKDKGIMGRLGRLAANRNKSKSFDRLNKADKWEEEEFYGEAPKLGTMVFERSRSSDQLNVTERKPPVHRGSSLTKTPKKYSFSAMRRPRADSFSSDISTGTGSDWSTEDLDFDKDTDSKVLDWDKEVERELALQVQDETQKMNEWFEKQESGLSQGRSRETKVDATEGHGDEKYNTLPLDSRHKKKINENRSRRKERRRGSFDVNSRDSSVASVASVTSVQSAYSGDGRRRRRRRRKSSTGSAYSEKMGSTPNLNDPRNMNIKVTCAQNNRRQVKVDAGFIKDRDAKSRDLEGFNRQHPDKHQGPANREHGNRGKDKTSRSKEQFNAGKGEKDLGRSASNRQPQQQQQQEPFYPRENPRERWNKGDRHRERDFPRDLQSGGGQDRSKHRNNSSSMDHTPSGTPPKGGGLLHIPATSGVVAPVSSHNAHPNQPNHHHQQQQQHQQHHQQHHPQHHQHPQHSHGTTPPQNEHYRGMGRGRHNSGGSNRQKTLFDPDNPSKPIIISDGNSGPPESGKLEFKDTDEPYSVSPNSPQQYPPPEMMMAHQGFTRPPPNFYPPQGYGYGYNNDSHYAMGPPPPMVRPGMERMFYGFAPPDSTLYHDDTYAQDPYYHDVGYDQESVIAGRSRSQCRMMAEQLLREALPLDKQLNNLISRRIGGEDTLHMINQLRRELQVRLEQVILLDPDLANKQNAEQILWKSVFYQMVELSRKQLSEDKDEESKAKLSKILEEGSTFYETLLQKLQSTFKFELDIYLDANSLPPDNQSRAVKLALLSAQRTMICLGDIARYKEQSNETGKVNYAKARSWYVKAQQIAPKNGRPYNQLAILALYTRRKLDAVYYYMRSLAASNPFITARESLMSLFDEARKKAEDVEKKRSQEKNKQEKIRANRTTHKHRVEIWIHGDGSSTEDKVSDDYSEDLSKIDAVELNKRFVLSFLNVHGKLFTKIGMETFADSCGMMLREFQALCQDNAISPSRFLQLMAINMFAIENTALKDESLESTCRSLLQEHAVQLGLDMFGILISQCSQQLEIHIATKDYPTQMFSRELEELVPSVKVWTDWMICHAELWNPPPAVRDPAMGPEINVWACTANLCNVLKDMDTSHVKFYTEKKENCDPVILSEDCMMSGFVPLLSTPISNTFVHSTVDKEISRDCLRINKLRVFGEYLCGIEPPMLAFSVEKNEYYSVAPSQGYDDEEETKKQNGSEADDIVIESEEEVLFGEEGEGEEHVQRLRAKKEELQRKMREKAKQQENIQNMLEKNRHKSIELEIRPIFLIPDTNCFIDHLPSLKKLIEDKHYTIVIPLVVINELDGLAQGSRDAQSRFDEHAERVKNRAKATIEYLEQEFEKKHSHLKAQTSKGSILETIAFRSEETDSSGNNDDLILSCCLHYCKDKAQNFMPKDKDSPVRLYRDVVLLTDDRNLRLKAHTCNVPVKEVPAFMGWSCVK